MPYEHQESQAQRPYDESAVLPELRGEDASPDELRPIYDRLQADARAWSATVASETALVAFVRSLPRRGGRFGREAEETRAMHMPPERPGPAVMSRPAPADHHQPPSSPLLRGRALPAIAAAVLIVALLGGALYALSSGRGRGTAPVTTATATTTRPQPTRTPEPSATATLPPAGQGWTKSGPAYFYGDVAVAPSQPATLYSCGQPPFSNGDPNGPNNLGISHDGGKTWQTSSLPSYCATLRVSPSNPLDVAFEGGICGSNSGCPAGTPGAAQAFVYASADGGLRWTRAQLPANVANAPVPFTYFFAWVGTTLFVAPGFDTQQTLSSGTHVLAASANGAPFTWVDQNGLRAHMQGNAVVDLLTTVGDTLYVNFGADSCVTPQCSGVAKTSDGGTTWTSISASYQGAPLVITAGASGRTLIAHPRSATYITGPLLASGDGGTSWKALPALPGGASPQDAGTFETPDGTLYVETNTDPNPIYKLAPNASAWTLAAPHVSVGGPGDLAAVSWDANGHPLLLWEAALGEGLFSHPA